MGLESLMQALGLKKKDLPTDENAKLRALFGQLRGPDARKVLPQIESILKDYRKKYDVSTYEDQAKLFRSILYPKGNSRL